MGKQTFTSRLVNCPICELEVKSRGLHSHLRLVHPNSDLKGELRKKIIQPVIQNERIVFSLSQYKGNYLMKQVLTNEEVEFLADFFYVWAENGSWGETMMNKEIIVPDNKSVRGGHLQEELDDI